MNPLPDSGARSTFSTGGVRDASAGKGLPSRIPAEALRALARRFEDGEAKYPDVDGTPNWMRGIPLSRYFDSAFRHLLQASEGDTTEDHFGAVLWNISCWMWTAGAIERGELPAELDDLPFRKHQKKVTLQEMTDASADDGDPSPEAAAQPSRYADMAIQFANQEAERARKIRFGNLEVDAPELPEGFTGFKVLPATHGPQEGDMSFFWYQRGEPCSGWRSDWGPYSHGPHRSEFHWIVATRPLVPGDRIEVTDDGGVGEPHVFETTVLEPGPYQSTLGHAIVLTPHGQFRESQTRLLVS